jgi:flagella basal body P-ring formation protein FlgA
MRCISRSTILLVSWTSLAFGAGIADGGCLEVDGARIHAGRLAERVAAFAALDSGADLGPAPVGSLVRVFTRTQLQSLLGLEAGATADLPNRLCVTRKRQTIPREQWQAAAEKAVAEVCGSMPWRASVTEFSKQAYPAGELQFSPTGLGPVAPVGARNSGRKRPRSWRGQLVLPERTTIPVWIQLELETQAETAVAVRDLAAGTVLRTDDYKVEPVWRTETGGGTLCSASAPAPQAGMVLSRSVAAGEALPLGSVRRAPAVRRGATVELEVEAGAAMLRAPATAEADAEIGEPVRVRNHWNGRGQVGKVAGNGRVRLE